MDYGPARTKSVYVEDLGDPELVADINNLIDDHSEELQLHEWTSIQLNLNVKKAKRHQDGDHEGLSGVVGLGEYTGGEMVLEGIGIL